MINKSAIFWNLIARFYAKQVVANKQAYKRKLKETDEVLTPQSKVLELGCGTGSTAIFHAPKVKKIIAYDIAKNMITIAKEKAKAEGITNIDFRVSPIEKIEFPEEEFDAVLVLNTFHLVKDRDQLMQKIHKTLRPNGYFISSTMFLSESMPALKWIGPIGHFCGLLPFIKCFTKDEFYQSLQEQGFLIEKSWSPNMEEATFIIARKI